MRSPRTLFALASLLSFAAFAQNVEPKPNDPYFAKFEPKKAPRPPGLVLREGDRLAICGDSITEQKMYSRIMETYLTVAVPELNVTVRQYGWSGETAPGFYSRMANDCLRFKPTIATTCYGMNDHGYRPYSPDIGERYKDASLKIVRAFKDAGARVVQGSPGSIGKIPPWSQFQNSSKEALNLNLCELRNIGVDIAQSEQVYFADIFWPMLTLDFEARKKYGDDYAVPGKDGVHPGWAGQVVMAYAFLKSFGLEGDIGTFNVDLAHGTATATRGHEILSCKNGELEIKSSRYPFCAAGGDLKKDDNIRSGMALVPFDVELNRLMLVVKNPAAKSYRITWGSESRTFTGEQLGKGINLAEEFQTNPFSQAFAKVDNAVAAKQNFETKQIKEFFHGELGRADMEMTASLTEKARAPLAAAIKSAFVPVTHTIKIAAE